MWHAYEPQTTTFFHYLSSRSIFALERCNSTPIEKPHDVHFSIITWIVYLKLIYGTISDCCYLFTMLLSHRIFILTTLQWNINQFPLMYFRFHSEYQVLRFLNAKSIMISINTIVWLQYDFKWKGGAIWLTLPANIGFRIKTRGIILP